MPSAEPASRAGEVRRPHGPLRGPRTGPAHGEHQRIDFERAGRRRRSGPRHRPRDLHRPGRPGNRSHGRAGQPGSPRPGRPSATSKSACSAAAAWSRSATGAEGSEPPRSLSSTAPTRASRSSTIMVPMRFRLRSAARAQQPLASTVSNTAHPAAQLAAPARRHQPPRRLLRHRERRRRRQRPERPRDPVLVQRGERRRRDRRARRSARRLHPQGGRPPQLRADDARGARRAEAGGHLHRARPLRPRGGGRARSSPARGRSSSVRRSTATRPSSRPPPTPARRSTSAASTLSRGLGARRRGEPSCVRSTTASR